KTADDRPDRADCQAVAAELAVKGDAAVRTDEGLTLFFVKTEGVDHLDLFADVDALAAEDAALHVEIENEAPGVFGDLLPDPLLDVIDPEIVGHVLQFAFAVGVADRAVEG